MIGRPVQIILLLALIAGPLFITPSFAHATSAAPGKTGGVDRQALREELMKLPPDQRRARMQELREQFLQQHQQQLAARQQKIRDRWNRATPEQRAKFCTNVQSRCTANPQAPACQMAGPLCSGQGG